MNDDLRQRDVIKLIHILLGMFFVLLVGIAHRYPDTSPMLIGYVISFGYLGKHIVKYTE